MIAWRSQRFAGRTARGRAHSATSYIAAWLSRSSFSTVISWISMGGRAFALSKMTQGLREICHGGCGTARCAAEASARRSRLRNEYLANSMLWTCVPRGKKLGYRSDSKSESDCQMWGLWTDLRRILPVNSAGDKAIHSGGQMNDTVTKKHQWIRNII